MSEKARIKRAKKRRRIDVKYEDADFEEDAAAEKKLEESAWEPLDWRLHLENIKSMRSDRSAPVDKMGAECHVDNTLPPEVSRLHVLVSLLLSSQTKDQITSRAVQRLKEHGLTVDNVLATSEQKIKELIYPVGFHNRKAGYLKKTCQVLKDKFNCDIPHTVDELCSLPGVGPKMAHLAMTIAWGKCTGIAVDTHVHRIANRLHWVKNPTKVPERTRKALEAWIPIELWRDINLLLVGFGQQICLPVSPHCHDCLNRLICPSAKVTSKKQKTH
eukprot:m.22865 g.22865  ORF g.22865 m.22865 type:complete len:273 (+) comp28413_c0_seq1:101-919(+)